MLYIPGSCSGWPAGCDNTAQTKWIDIHVIAWWWNRSLQSCTIYVQESELDRTEEICRDDRHRSTFKWNGVHHYTPTTPPSIPGNSHCQDGTTIQKKHGEWPIYFTTLFHIRYHDYINSHEIFFFGVHPEKGCIAVLRPLVNAFKLRLRWGRRLLPPPPTADFLIHLARLLPVSSGTSGRRNMVLACYGSPTTAQEVLLWVADRYLAQQCVFSSPPHPAHYIKFMSTTNVFTTLLSSATKHSVRTVWALIWPRCLKCKHIR